MKLQKIKAWAAVNTSDEIVIIGDVDLRIFEFDCKIFADNFVNARNKMAGRKITKVVPCEIILKPKKK